MHESNKTFTGKLVKVNSTCTKSWALQSKSFNESTLILLRVKLKPLQVGQYLYY